jgi:phage terminase large subunit-like protein
MHNWSQIARGYEADILAEKIPACNFVKLACRRSVEDFDRYAAHDAPYQYVSEKVDDVCEFLSTLQNVADGISTRAGDPLTLLPFQVWQLANIFGWVWRDDGTMRFKRSYVEEGRGNGKTTLSAGCMLYKTFACGIYGAQGVCAASLLPQARLVLDTAREMILRDEQIRNALGLTVSAHTIFQPATGSKLWALPKTALSAEGLSLDAAVLDELMAQRGRALHDVLSSGVSKRNNSLFMMVTTAGDDSSGVAFEIRSFLEKLLTGECNDPSFFCAMYTTDPDADWRDTLTHRKSNPGWGVMVSPKAIAEECERAKMIPGARNNFRARHCCEWTLNGGDEPFLDDRLIKKCYDADLDEKQFDGQPACLAADLASRIDLCSVARVQSRRINGKIHHYAFVKNWLPTAQRNATPGYAAWADKGELVFTEGSTTDQDVVEQFIFDELERFKVRDCSFDATQASQLMSHVEKRGGTVLEIPQNAKNMTPGVHELQEAIHAGRFHTNSQMLIWALGNLRVKTFGNGLLQPHRPARRELKIDPAIAALMCLRSVTLVPLDETKCPPRIFSIDWNEGTITDHSHPEGATA